MKFFFKCFTVFIALWALFIASDLLFFQFDIDFSGIFLYSGVLSIVCTLIYGWIDDVFIHHRQPELDELQ